MHRAAATPYLLALAVLAALSPAESAAQERSTHELLRDGAIAIEEGRFASAAARFREASYEMNSVPAGTRVLRLTELGSRLRPGWYWRSIEAAAVQAEHEYVLENLRRNVEGTNTLAATVGAQTDLVSSSGVGSTR